MARLRALLFLLGLSLGNGSSSAALNSMLETIKEQVASNTKVTPEVAAGFQKMADLIEEKIVPAIRADFEATQKKITQLRDDLAVDSTAAISQKTNLADPLHAGVFACFAEEKKQQCEWEACRDACIATCKVRDEECAEVEPIFKWAIDDGHFNPKTCDLDAAKDYTDCAPLFALDTQTTSRGKAIEADYKDYVIQKRECDEAEEKCQKCTADCAERRNNLDDHKEDCAGKHREAVNQICKFGILLQEKCVELAEYDDLVAATNQLKGSSWSEADRKNEFAAAKQVKCWLEAYDGAEANFKNQEAQECIKLINYKSDIGELDVHEGEVSDIRSVYQMTCKDSHTVFHPQEWVLSGTGPAATCPDYDAVDAKYPVAYEGHPYLFCGATA